MLSSLFLLALLELPNGTVVLSGFTSRLEIAEAPQGPTVPTGPVVRMTGPVPAAVDMYADGSTVLYKQPLNTVARIPPQDSNDVAQKFALFGCEAAALATNQATQGNAALQALLVKHNIKCQ